MQEETTTGWAGWAAFAGFMMIMIGVFQVITGFAGIIHDDFYVASANYVFKLDATSWGWIHLLWGVVVLFAGFGVFKGAVWARTVGVDGRDDQRDRQLRVHPVPAGVVDHHHHRGRARDLGAHRPWS